MTQKLKQVGYKHQFSFVKCSINHYTNQMTHVLHPSIT